MATSARVLRAVALLFRFTLAGIFLYAAYTKLTLPWQIFAMSIDSFKFFPPFVVEWSAKTLPWIELIVLLSGRFAQSAAAASTLLLMVFNFLVIRAYVRGDQVDCGCFGPGGVLDWKKLVEDGSMLAMSLFVLAMAVRNRRKTV